MDFSENKFVDYPNLWYMKIIQNIEKYDIMNGGTKADVLEGVGVCPYLVEFSVYDTNLAIFCLWWLISWCVTSTKRISITVQLSKTVKLQVYRIELKHFITIT